MFIDFRRPKSSSLQRSETDNRLAYHCPRHCAPLVRRSAFVAGLYKHLTPLEPAPLLGDRHFKVVPQYLQQTASGS